MAAWKRIPVNAPTASTAVIALRREMTKRGIAFAGITVEDSPEVLPDSMVALTVTNPTGPRSTFICIVTR